MSKRRRNLLAQSNNEDKPLYIIRGNEISYGYTYYGYTYPNYTTPNDKRAIYVPFDVLLPEAGHYSVTVTSVEPDLYFTVQFFSYAQLDQIAQQQSIGSVYSSSGWRQNTYSFYLPISGQDDIAGFRILFGKGSTQSDVIDSSINPTVEVRRIV